jgi:hypothetical protein
MAVAQQCDTRFATLLFKSFRCIFVGFKHALRPEFTCKMMAQTLDENRQIHAAHSHSFSKEKFRHAITVANILAKKLKDQEEVVRRQKFHLLVLYSELKERKHNPLGVPGPTPEQQKEAWQKELEERVHKASEQERWERCEKNVRQTRLLQWSYAMP